MALEALPLTPNGKVDRQGLPAPETGNARKHREHVAANSPRERMLAEICADVLNLDRIGVEESLFDLGADSIHLFQIVARAERSWDRP